MSNNSDLTRRQADNVRSRIAKHATEIGQKLIDCVNGDIELSTQQINCAKLLLDKSVPSLTATDLNVNSTGLSYETEEQAHRALSDWLDKNPALGEILRNRGVVVEPDSLELLPSDTDA